MTTGARVATEAVSPTCAISAAAQSAVQPEQAVLDTAVSAMYVSFIRSTPLFMLVCQSGASAQLYY